ncbi:hypothetical protein F4808DRAFT_233851 [Astrocystis sublimbata]|nr:hypothetical protein F4808DRAFT_233851 [Astrocystis sublimbata]
MKYSSVLSLAMAPLAMAKAIQNVYPVQARTEGKKGKELLAGNLGSVLKVEASAQIIVIWINPGNGAETTTKNDAVTVTKTVTAGAEATASGTAEAGAMATHHVQVGGSAGLAYSPPEIKAAVGDMVIFTFMSQNHTVTQSTFALPCDPMEGGQDSGFMANMDNSVNPPPQMAVQVMDEKPLWFYCAQKGHCGKGMTFSINPTADKTQAMFQAMAIQQKGMGAGSAITGNATAAPEMEAPPPPPTEAPAGDAPAPTETPAAGETPAPVGSDSPIQTGTGEIKDGACVCAVVCGAGSFPAAAVQGLGAFGGIPGSLPASMAEKW